MKTITFFLTTLLLVFNLTAQDKGFVHTATAANITGATTALDYSALNGNPNAKVMFCQRGGGAENNNPAGIYYNTATSKWVIFNENQVDMANGVKFNIYIADDSEVTTHISDASTNPTGNHITTLDPSFVEGDYVFSSNYWNPNGVYNPFVYGSYYSGGLRSLYTETTDDIPEGAAFKVMKGSSTSAALGGALSTGNIDGNSMEIDHPALNNNPDAVFLYNHYYGINGHSVYLPYVTRAIYHPPTNRWRIYAYGAGGSFPENVWIDFIIPDEILGTNEVQAEISKVSIYPNPAVEQVNISSSKEIIQAVEVYSVTGKLVQSTIVTGKTVSLNVSSLSAGLYMTKVKTEEGWFSQKLIKR